MSAQLTVWTTPSSYFGFNPVGHILVAAKHRESSVLDKSNFDVARQRLSNATNAPIAALEDIAKDGPFSRYNPDTTPLVYTWVASCSLVGWIEYLMLRPCREAREAIAEARRIAAAIARYPVLSDDDYSERQYEGALSYWEREPLRFRIDMCRENGESIFAARHDSPPDRVFGWLTSEVFA